MDQYRLAFFLPRALALSIPPGRYHPCLAGCVVRTNATGWTIIEGPSREQIFAQTRKFLRKVCAGHGRQDITLILRTPRDCGEREKWIGRAGGGVDSWTAIIGADIAIVPGRIVTDYGRVWETA